MSEWCISLIRRERSDKQTLGRAFVFSPEMEKKFSFYTLELPWRENARSISCIPVGKYPLKKRYSPKYGHHLIVENVPDRSYILIHFGNYYTNTRGCILPGEEPTDINGDGYQDVTRSKPTMERILELLPDESHLVITEKYT